MITSPQEYKELLNQLVDPNQYKQYIQMPQNEPIYKIDLNSRKIEAPEFISVSEDHNAEVLWFSVDRFYDCYDLYKCTCWIQYINANKEKFYYAAPLFVRGEEYGSDTILIPWVVSKEAAAKEGAVEFAFQFFTLSEDKMRFNYILNTNPAKSKVLQGLRIDDPENDATKEFAADELHKIYSELDRLKGEYNLYWIEV